MKLITNITEANSLLKEYRGARLEIRIFTTELWRLAIRLSLTDLAKVVYIVGVGCKHICGNFMVRDVDLTITEETKEKLTVISDVRSDFKLISSGGFAVAYGLEEEFGTSFNNFLRE